MGTVDLREKARGHASKLVAKYGVMKAIGKCDEWVETGVIDEGYGEILRDVLYTHLIMKRSPRKAGKMATGQTDLSEWGGR